MIHLDYLNQLYDSIIITVFIVRTQCKFNYYKRIKVEDNMIQSEKLRNAYERLEKEYNSVIGDNHRRTVYNPVKHSFDLGTDGKVITAYLNVMYAKSHNGVITKTISMNDLDKTKKTNEDIIYTDNELNVYRASNIGLTPLRCALMACLSIDNYLPISPAMKIGFIGNGKINMKTCECLHTLFGISDFVIRGSIRNRAKNKDQFIELSQSNKVVVDDTDDFSLLNECDAIVVCTTSTEIEHMISYQELSKPKLFVIQDSGYLFDESFRQIVSSYTDHVEQIMSHYHEEFPHDSKIHAINQMHIRHTDTKGKHQKAVYLYGIAFADCVVFEEVFLEDIKKQQK